MQSDYAPQYGKPCVDLTDGEPTPTPDQLVAFALEIAATYEDEPGETDLVIQFPGRPQEIYSIGAARRAVAILARAEGAQP